MNLLHGCDSYVIAGLGNDSVDLSNPGLVQCDMAVILNGLDLCLVPPLVVANLLACEPSPPVSERIIARSIILALAERRDR